MDGRSLTLTELGDVKVMAPLVLPLFPFKEIVEDVGHAWRQHGGLGCTFCGKASEVGCPLVGMNYRFVVESWLHGSVISRGCKAAQGRLHVEFLSIEKIRERSKETTGWRVLRHLGVLAPKAWVGAGRLSIREAAAKAICERFWVGDEEGGWKSVDREVMLRDDDAVGNTGEFETGLDAVVLRCSNIRQSAAKGIRSAR